MELGAQRVIDLVHRRDSLVSERVRVTKDLDAEIASIDRELAAAGDILKRSGEAPSADAQIKLNLKVRAGSNAEKVMVALAKAPGMGIGELAIAVYGEDTAHNRHKIRAVTFNLRRTGRLAKRATEDRL
jgi:hypothetical protein